MQLSFIFKLFLSDIIPLRLCSCSVYFQSFSVPDAWAHETINNEKANLILDAMTTVEFLPRFAETSV